MTKKIEDMKYNWGTKVGDVYGKLEVIAMADKDKQGQRMWTVKCECGTVKDVAGYRIRRGNAKSCGCSANRAGGRSKTRLYQTYRAMIRRCTAENDASYHSYGGRGITVCNQWMENPEAFYQWALASGYRDDLTIERIDNDGNYEPDNCRWATMFEQGQNKRTNVWIEIDGETKTLSEWARHAGIPINTIKQRRFRGKTGHDLIAPLKNPKRKRLDKQKLYWLGNGEILNVKEIEAKYDVKASTFHHRLRAGWKTEGLVKPVMKRKEA